MDERPSGRRRRRHGRRRRPDPLGAGADRPLASGDKTVTDYVTSYLNDLADRYGRRPGRLGRRPATRSSPVRRVPRGEPQPTGRDRCRASGRHHLAGPGWSAHVRRPPDVHPADPWRAGEPSRREATSRPSTSRCCSPEQAVDELDRTMRAIATERTRDPAIAVVDAPTDGGRGGGHSRDRYRRQDAAAAGPSRD